MDHDKVTKFLERFVADLGATGAAGSVMIGYRLGLYRALAQGPATLADRGAGVLPGRPERPPRIGRVPPCAG